MRSVLFLALTIAIVFSTGACSPSPRGRKVRVAAASDLARAFTELGKEFHARTGITPEFEFDSSGLLAKQIERGAPYFLYAAANQSFVTQVLASGRCDPTTARMYGRGRIVVWTKNGVAAPVRLADLADPRFKRIAIANPEHAPYGLATKQALEGTGLWAKLESRIVLADNILETMHRARDGLADAAIVALSLAVVTDGGAFLKIDPALHDPLDQQLVVCGNGQEADAARQLAEFIRSREGSEIMTRYGFILPDEKPRT